MDRRAALILAAAGCVAAGAQAQSSCEQFRDRLAERMEADAKGLVLAIGPGSAAVPSGAKVVGNCEGGARKVLLFRSAAAAAAWTAGGASSAARPASAAATAGEAKPVAETKPAAVAPAGPAPAASAGTAPKRGAAPPVVVPAAPEGPAPIVSAAASAPQAPSAESALPPASGPRLVDRLREHWPWVAVPGALLLVAALWAWIAYRRAYDAQGLPRGPRLRA